MSPFLFGVIVTFLTECEAVTVEILKPIRGTGDEVALIFVPGPGIEGEQYRKTAEAIQEASELQVWVALTGNYLLDSPNIKEIPLAVKGAIAALGDAGMASENFVGVAHGTSGHSLQSYTAVSTTLKALVLMGSSLPRDEKLKDFPVPVLTLAAELDGITRVSRIAEEYRKLKEDLESSSLALYRTPVIIVEGANHGQFASGDMPRRVKDKDLKPDVTEEEAHREVGKRVNSFVTATFNSAADLGDRALADLEGAFFDANKILQPFIDIKDLNEKDGSSQFVVLAQKHFAGALADQIEVFNQVGRYLWYYYSEPSITVNQAGFVTVKTTAHFTGEDNHGLTPNRESPLELDMKLKSVEAIWKALGIQEDGTLGLPGNHTSFKGKPDTCRSLMELALELALKHSTEAARGRYNKRGRPLFFNDDITYPLSVFWYTKPLKVREDRYGLHVSAISFKTSTGSWVNPGARYCKVITPYRVMEWINIDSLREA